MIIDYVEIAKTINGKDNLCFDHLHRKAMYESGTKRYSLKGKCHELVVDINDRKQEVIVKGSMPFFNQPHNFEFNASGYNEVLSSISEMLNVDFYSGEIRKFEAGIILKIHQPPQAIFNAHLNISGMDTRPFRKGKYFDDAIMYVKLYDAGARIKQVCGPDIRRELANKMIYDPKANYLRFENHYKKPLHQFRRQSIIASDLYASSFQPMIKEDILLTYQSIMKSHKIQLPKKANSGELAIAMIKELCYINGVYPEDFIKKFIKDESLNASLNKDDLKNRRRTLISWLKNVPDQKNSTFDLTDIIIMKLEEAD